MSGPLHDVVVVDLTRVLAGPYCTMVLADLGARVTKVEHPDGGDDARAIGPFVDDRSAYFSSLNRGKESVALDLKKDEDRAVFEALLETADVLVENFRPGTMEKLGYGWDDVHHRWPRLVYAAASGFGHSGPLSQRPAYDMVAQGMGGIMSITGWPGGGPTRVGTSVGDITAGLFTAIGILSALHHRATTGEAVKVDVAMLDCQVAILENAIARYVATGDVPGPLGARHPSITPFGAFRTADGHMIVAAGNNALFRRLCDVAGRPAVADDERFATNDLRCRHESELKDLLEEALSSRTTADWLSVMEEAGLPCSPINDVAQVLAHPQVVARNMVVTAGGLRMAGNPVKLSGFDDPATRPPAPDLDDDRAAVLGRLGLNHPLPGGSDPRLGGQVRPEA